MSEGGHGLFEKSLAASFALHAGFFLIGGKLPFASLNQPLPPPVEIDLTQPPGTGPMKLGAPKRLTPNAPPGPALPAPEPIPIKEDKPTEVKPVAPPPSDWTLPGPKTQETAKAAEPAATPGGTIDGTGTAAKLGGSGDGSNEGVPGGTGTGAGGTVDVNPKLLNRDEIITNRRRFYPENERQAGREATVVVDLHISADGAVTAVDIVSTGGMSFDRAAREIARFMKFSPARVKGGAVAVKIRQAIPFKLEEDE